MHKRLFIGIITAICLLLSVPVVAAELNLGGGTPLWDTHTDDDDTGFDGGWLFFASVDKPVKAKPWLSYGLMYNYTRIEMHVDKTTTEWHYEKYFNGCNRECGEPPLIAWSTTTTTHVSNWLDVHVLGPYVKPSYKIGDRVKLFGMIGMGGMYVDGAIYGDEFGPAGFASAGLSVDITKHLGMGAQILYVKGYTNHVDDIDYLAPVATISYRW